MTRSQLIGCLMLLLAAWMEFGGGGGVFVTEGPRHVMIPHETADDTPAIANELAALRMGTHEAYLKSKGHTLDILDDDKLGPDGQPPALLNKFKPYALPEVLVIQPPDKLLARQPFTTADAAIELLKKNGG